MLIIAVYFDEYKFNLVDSINSLIQTILTSTSTSNMTYKYKLWLSHTKWKQKKNSISIFQGNHHHHFICKRKFVTKKWNYELLAMTLHGTFVFSFVSLLRPQLFARCPFSFTTFYVSRLQKNRWLYSLGCPQGWSENTKY